jgi:hypothetical protein
VVVACTCSVSIAFRQHFAFWLAGGSAVDIEGIKTVRGENLYQFLRK